MHVQPQLFLDIGLGMGVAPLGWSPSVSSFLCRIDGHKQLRRFLAKAAVRM
jgi:hypothetical protein